MSSNSEATLQVSQGRRIPSFLFLNSASRSSSSSTSTQSTPFGTAFGISFFLSPEHKPHLEMYASPPPPVHSQNFQKLSPALAASPHLFTPPVPMRGALTPGLSPIDRSPRPPRPIHILTRTPTRRPFLEKLLNVRDDSEDDLGSENDVDESSLPPSPVHLGCTSTPLRATRTPSVSPFSSPLSTSSSPDFPLSCAPAPYRPVPSPSKTRSDSGNSPPSAVTLKRPTNFRTPIHRENKRLKASESSPSPSVPPLRTFPSSIPIHREFPGFYIRFPVIPLVFKAYVRLSFATLHLTVY